MVYCTCIYMNCSYKLPSLSFFCSLKGCCPLFLLMVASCWYLTQWAVPVPGEAHFFVLFHLSLISLSWKLTLVNLSFFNSTVSLPMYITPQFTFSEVRSVFFFFFWIFWNLFLLFILLNSMAQSSQFKQGQERLMEKL